MNGVWRGRDAGAPVGRRSDVTYPPPYRTPRPGATGARGHSAARATPQPARSARSARPGPASLRAGCLTSAQALAALAGALAGQREAAREHARHSGAGSASSCPEVEAVSSSLRRTEVGAALIGLVLFPLGLQTE